jgi:hypothetical protein
MPIRMDSFVAADAAGPGGWLVVRGRWVIYVAVMLVVLLLAARDRVASTATAATPATSSAEPGDARDALLLPTH